MRHGKCARITPDSVGPSAGATEITMDTLPITTPRRCLGTSIRMVVISRGSMIAEPKAWTTRARISTPKLGVRAASSVPREKLPMARAKTVRVPKRCSRNPVVGMTTAMVSMKEVVTHWTVAALTAMSAMMCGRATLRTVSLRITTNAATSSTAMVAVVPAVDCGRSSVGAAEGMRGLRAVRGGGIRPHGRPAGAAQA